MNWMTRRDTIRYIVNLCACLTIVRCGRHVINKEELVVQIALET
jgi:hypothetical protein